MMLEKLVQYLRNENPSLKVEGLPLKEQYRALVNVRPPQPISADFLKWQNAYLTEERERKGVVEAMELPTSQLYPAIALWQGDITRLKVDAIVNAANNQLLGCFAPLHNCIDNAIHTAAGVQLRADCNALMQAQGHKEATGTAKITKGYNLPAKYVLHTVGPIVGESLTPLHCEQLASCYKSCLEVAEAHSLQSVAFCCISTGVFRFPNREAAQIAVQTVTDYVANHPNSSIKRIIFNVFKEEDFSIYQQLLTKK